MGSLIPTRFVGALTAAAVAVTTLSAAPAYADRDDRAARAVAAILGLAVVGAIINDNKQDKKKRATHAPVRKPQVHVHRSSPKARRQAAREQYRYEQRQAQRRAQIRHEQRQAQRRAQIRHEQRQAQRRAHNRRIYQQDQAQSRVRARPLPQRVQRQNRN